MATYVNDLRLKEISTGDESGTWGTSTNTNLELIAEAFGRGTKDCFSSDADATETIADGSSDEVRKLYLKITSSATLTATRTLTLAPNTVSKVWIIENATTGSQAINISQGSGANVQIPNGKVKVIATDGAGSGAAVYDLFTDLNVAGNFEISGDLTVTGDDITLGTNTAGHVLVADGTNYNPVALSNDATIASSGALTIANAAVSLDKLAANCINTSKIISGAVTTAELGDDAVTAAKLASNAVVNASVASGAAIDATKIANGTVSNTEFQYLNGVTSGVQIQLNNAYSSTDSSVVIQNGTSFRRASGGSGITNATTKISFYVGSTERAYLDDSGNFVADGNVGAYSDVSLKEDIHQIENALEKVNNLRGVHFTRSATQEKEIGVVANEVEKIVPELVADHQDKELGSIKVMKYANTVGLLIEAVKELSNQVEDLKNGSSS